METICTVSHFAFLFPAVSQLKRNHPDLNFALKEQIEYIYSSLCNNRATTNKKLRETVQLELSFVNSNLQLLKEKLAVLNSSVEVYQAGDGRQTDHIPMIPLGLKETKEVPFHDSLFVSSPFYREKELLLMFN